jgi:hypothetical protein
MSILGIDPAYAKQIAFAYKRGKEWKIESLSPKKPGSWLSLFCQAKAAGVHHVVIEGGFVGINNKVALGLAQIRGALWATATLSGLPVSYVPPSTWQAAMGAQALRARAETGRNDLNADEQAAVCIAAWGEAQRF